MKLYRIALTFFWLGTLTVFAQTKQITLEEIYDGTFSQQRMESLRSLQNGTEYIVVNQDKQKGTSTIDVYDYKSGEKKKTLLNSGDLKEIDRIQGYQLSDDEKKILIGSQTEQIFRRSSRGIYYVYDTTTKTLTKISENKIQEPTFSPDGTKVAYLFENNIYFKALHTGTETQVNTDG